MVVFILVFNLRVWLFVWMFIVFTLFRKWLLRLLTTFKKTLEGLVILVNFWVDAISTVVFLIQLIFKLIDSFFLLSRCMLQFLNVGMSPIRLSLSFVLLFSLIIRIFFFKGLLWYVIFFLVISHCSITFYYYLLIENEFIDFYEF